MTNPLRKLQARWRLIRDHDKELNRRVDVERVLWDVVAGKHPPIGADEARELALKLGVPDCMRSDTMTDNRDNRLTLPAIVAWAVVGGVVWALLFFLLSYILT